MRYSGNKSEMRKESKRSNSKFNLDLESARESNYGKEQQVQFVDLVKI